MLDLQTLSADDGTHLVVRDEKLDGCEILALDGPDARSRKKGRLRTMGAVALNDAAHAHGRSSLQQGAGDNHVCLRYGVASTSDGQNSIVYTLDHLGDASFDASLVAQFGDVLATLSDDDTGLFGRHNGAQGQLGLGIFFVGARCGLAVGAEAAFIVELNAIKTAGKVVTVGRDVLRSRHGVRGWDEDGGDEERKSARGPKNVRLEIKQQSRDGNGAVGLGLVKYASVILINFFFLSSNVACEEWESDDGV